MKNFNKNILGAALTLAVGATLVGCNDYLDITPPSYITPETYLTTADQLGTYTIQLYDNGSMDGNRDAGAFPHFGYSGSGYQFYLKTGDENTDNESGTGTSGKFHNGASTKVGTGTGGSWSFGQINNINYFLETVIPRYEAGEIKGDENLIRHYIGEGYLLRSIEYFKRLRYLGDFPIITNTLPMDKEALIEASKRAPRNEVCRFILSDIDKAIELLSDGANTGGKNRITRDVAYLQKARVALYEATFEKYFAGTPFVPDKSAGWPGAQKDYNANYVYDNAGEVNFFLDQALAASKYIADKYPTLVPNNKKVLGDTYQNMPANPYYDMWVSQKLNDYENEVLMWRFYDLDVSGGHSLNQYMRGQNGYTQEYANAFVMANGLPIYDPNSGYAGDDHIADTKKNRDYRWQLFMKANNEYIYEGDAEQKTGIAKKRGSKDFIAPGIVSGTYVSTKTGYHKAKGFCKNADWNKGGHDLTAAICYRTAEAYLIYMEAAWEKYGDGLDADAWTYWNKIRTRAGLPDAQVTINATDLDKEEEYTHDFGMYSGKTRITSKVLFNIRRERRCELCSEGFRWDDLIRWRSMEHVQNYYLHGCKIFGPMLSDFPSQVGALKYDQKKEDDNNVSSPTDMVGAFNGDPRYFSLFRINSAATFYADGMCWRMGHYLDPINYGHFLESTMDGISVENSPIYQNPYWPVEGDATAIQ